MKATFFAILASAAVVFASPLPEAEADAFQQGMPPAYAPQGGFPPQGQFPPGGGIPPQGQFPPGGGFPPNYDPPAYFPPQGGPGFGGPPQIGGGGVVGGVQGQFQGQFQGTFGGFLAQGIPPPPQFGLQQWPQPGGFPQGSLFNNQGISSFGNTCSNTQQAVSCCSGGDSGGLLGGILPSTCSLDLLSPACNQNVACCDTQTQNGLVNIGLQCSSLL